MITPILLVGAGSMAIEYSKVLVADGRSHLVLGRGAESAQRFQDATGIEVSTGTLDEQLGELAALPREAIVAVNAMHLADVTIRLAVAGVRRILVEKPAALDEHELARLLAVAVETGADIRIGYNRRFLASVTEARRIVAEDGGVRSVTFDFSEPSRRIAGLNKPKRELDTWFYGNSSHVVDLALHFAGPCDEAFGAVVGGVDWHQDGGVFAGHARACSGALVSWHANWEGPGRWAVQLVTQERRLILQPLERLFVQDHRSFTQLEVELDLELDSTFKPGLAGQVRAFLSGIGDEHLPRLDEHAGRWWLYEIIRTGTTDQRAPYRSTTHGISSEYP